MSETSNQTVATISPAPGAVVPDATSTAAPPAESAAKPSALTAAAATVLAPANSKDFNRSSLDFRKPVPRPKVRGLVIDAHCHLFAARHAPVWFEAAAHYGIDVFVTMTPLEEAVLLQREYPNRLQFIAIPKWTEIDWDDWHRRLESFYNIGSRIIKFHMAPGTMDARKYSFESPGIRKIIADAKSRGMILMSHLGDPTTWYESKYTDHARYGTREEHYRMWEAMLEEHRGHPWLGAHLGGNPEDLPRLQSLLDRFPDLILDCSATRWMVREISARRDAAREFFIRNCDRIIFGSDQVSGDDRGFDFLASRFWCHRKLWDTAYQGPSPIYDPDLPADKQPTLRGLALPDDVLQKLYHDNAVKMLAGVGVAFPE